MLVMQKRFLWDFIMNYYVCNTEKALMGFHYHVGNADQALRRFHYNVGSTENVIMGF